MRSAALLAVSVLATLLAARAAATPLSVSDLMALSRSGLTDAAILRLVEAEGLLAPLTASQALELREAGLSGDLVSRLIEMGAEAISVEERDGVFVVTGRGPEPEEDAVAPEDERWGSAEPPAASPVQQVVVVQAPPATAPEEQAYGHPSGAVFGWSGGAVFLPARFGGSEPSPFGRTLVGFGAPLLPPPVALPVACAPGPWPLPAPTPRMITIDTSRGPLRVPN